MTTSMMMASGCASRASSSPDSPSSAVMTSNPAFCSNPFITWVSVAESSTIRIVDIDVSSVGCLTVLGNASLDGCQQFVPGKRLGNVFLGTDHAALGDVEQPILARKHDD